MFPYRKIEKFHLLGIKTLLFLIPCLPLYVSTSMPFPFITGKNFAFRIIVEFAAALWLGLIITNKEYRPRNSLLAVSILIFAFIVGLADLCGVNPYKSFWSNYERMEGYITILHLALFFMMLKSILKTKRDWRVFFSICLLASVFVCLFAFVFTQDESTVSFKRFAMEYGTRMYSTIGNPPFLASYLLLSIFIGLLLIFNTKKSYLKFLCLLSIVFNAAVIYLTATRGAILAGIAGIIFSLFFIIRGKHIFRKRSVIVLTACGLIILSGVFLTVHHSDFLEHDRTISRFNTMFADASGKSRLNVWGMALNAIKERPVLGWGQENFIGVYTVNPIPAIDGQIWLDRAHNIVIDWLVSAGFPGLFSYFAIFVSAFYLTRKAYREQRIKKSEALVIVTAFIVYFIQNLFTFDTINTYLIFFALLAYVDNCMSGENRLYPALKINSDPKKTMVKYVSAMSGVLLCFSFVFYYMNYKPIEQNRQIFRITFSSPEHDSYSILLGDFNKALSYNTFGNADVLTRMISISRNILRRHIIDQEGAMKFIQATIWGLGKGVALNRYDLEYLTNVINFLKEVAVYEPSFIARSEALIKGCIRMNPEYQWLYVALADVYILGKDYESAYASIRKIVDMDPENDRKQLKLALAAIYASKEDVLGMTLENIKKIRAARNKNIASGKETVLSAAEIYEFANAYKEIGNYKKAIEYLKKLTVVLSYSDKLYLGRDIRLHRPRRKARVHFELAQIYMLLGDRENAVKEAGKAAELDPLNFKGKSGMIID